jgi:Rps23 Pro-64 3,4-dihydroxylase Tpa1-like proline 4-hydroxylase
VLTRPAAEELHAILSQDTDWGLSWQAGEGPPEHIRSEDMAARNPEQRATIGHRLMEAMQRDDYGFSYGAYPLVDAYKEQWHPGHPLELLLEHLNDTPFLELMREVTGFPALAKADGQATLFGPGNFLSQHNDSHVAEGWRVAYVLNLTRQEWRPDWGGYLVFHDEAGDIVQGFRPRFNALNIFAVPQLHAVTFVPSFAPVGRYAITGWLRDR